MSDFNIYKDMAERTDNNIYIGVIGAVRTGKSTFIKRFMDTLVLPNIVDENKRQRTRDELPQSAAGKTIMTAEPKFIPNEPVKITLDDNIGFNVRMIDCVGYLIPGAEGHMDGDEPRMVNTPWSDTPVTFEKAAETGTEKVIREHSTIGIVVTCDGSITDIERENYVQAEKRVVNELKDIGKPFVIVLNSTHPYSSETMALGRELENEYGVAVINANCAQLKNSDINEILEKILLEFPIREIKFSLPKWFDTIDFDNDIKSSLAESLRQVMENTDKIKDIKNISSVLEENPYIRKVFTAETDMGTGCADIEISEQDGLFYKYLSETMNCPVENDYELVSAIKQMSADKAKYSLFENALSALEHTGYGIVYPSKKDIVFEEPKMYKQGQRYGIKIRAKGKSMHIIRADIEAEVSPVIGDEQQTKDYLEKLKNDCKNNADEVWNMNIFGRSLESLINDSIQSRLYTMNEDAQQKMRETLEKIANEGNGGLICILL